MRKSRLILNALTVIGLTLAATSLANAQATRTWVSGVGDDANPCSRTAPCKTFAGAISKTAAKGEISVLDPGGFGTLTITKSITVNGDGTLAGILAAGTVGIIVNALPATDIVYLRNITINGGGTGTNGIRYLAAKELHIENCAIYGFNAAGATNGNGIDASLTASGNLFVKDTTILNCSTNGIRISTTSGFAVSTMDHVSLEGLPTGLLVGNNAFVTVRNSVISQSGSTGVAITGAGATGNIENCILNNNPTAINVSATLNLTSSLVENNTTGVATSGSPTLRSGGNNRFLGNGSDGTALPIILPK
ncbi:MAG: right-handed parallel beta-helix repeat-containing protein [Pyrinomonadaceae bacterium]|nr:right-handed parallel beta-helix repeat-containing protein [Pyrinomonadaceae bacterium]